MGGRRIRTRLEAFAVRLAAADAVSGRSADRARVLTAAAPIDISPRTGAGTFEATSAPAGHHGGPADRPGTEDAPPRGEAGTFQPTSAVVRPLNPAATRTEADGIDHRLRDRLRTAAWCLALSLLAFTTRPGRILADTKIDMAVNPLGFLGRALHLWDTEQLGQLQNQAVGYLFPMGPFHALGTAVGIPAWITQRLWLAALLCAAFVGTRRLALRLGIGGPVTATLAGLVYALAPNGLATLGQISSEYLPFAMMPWIVLPLVTAAEGGDRIRMAARSGVAVAFCGGINAAATVAVLVAPVLYLLTRPRGARRFRIMAWWSIFVGFATLWWLFPLLLTGTYGFSWLTYTEKAVTTTGPTGLVNVLRGAERWVNYLFIDGQTWWPVGHAFSLSALPVLFTGLTAALGVAGLLRPRLPERAFLLLTLLAGIAIITAGHLSTIEGPVAAPVRELLDGALAPLRNVHKFDALVRLPLALGVANLVATIPRAVPRVRLRALAAASVALAGLAGTVLTTGGLSGPGDFSEVPRAWRDAAAWLNGRAGEQAVLAIPGSPFGEYLWGRPMDDIMQPLLSARWGVRQLVPAGSPGYTRALDAIDRQVATGRGGPGLAEFLGRMGIRYVLVRNDLEREGLRGAWPARLHEALEGSPGLTRVREFGDPVGGRHRDDDATGAFDQPYRAVEVYEVADADDVVSLADAGQTIRLYGSPDALLTMADNQALRGRPVLLNDDAADLGGTPVTTDALRLVRRSFGELHATSPTLTEADRKAATDILERGWSRYATTATFTGDVTAVTASSSAADPDSIPNNHDLGRLPAAAMDGNPFTSWETGGWSGPVGQWLRVDFKQARMPGKVTAAFVQSAGLGPPPGRVAVETEAGVEEQAVVATSSAQPLRVPAGPTRWLRIRITRLATEPLVPAFARVALAELTVDDVRAGREYILPAGGTGQAGVFVMSRAAGQAAECMRGPTRWVCDPELKRQDEEAGGFSRSFTAGAAGLATVTGRATLTDVTKVDQYSRLTAPAVETTASSTRADHPADRAVAAFDGDAATTWIADDQDPAPALSLTWKKPITINRITLQRPPSARGPLRVQITGVGGETRQQLVDGTGVMTFRPMRTNRLRLAFTKVGWLQPVQITELSVPGVEPTVVAPETPLRLPCGLGPNLLLRGAIVRTKAAGTMGDLLSGRPLRFEACGRVRLRAGANRLAPAVNDPYRIESMVVDAVGGPAAESGWSEVTMRRWSQNVRELEIQADRRSFLVVNENFNSGWEARADGRVLRPVRLDGWKQGWAVPAGTGGVVTLTYRPDHAHRLTVVIGLNLLLLLGLIAFWPVAQLRRIGLKATGPAPRPSASPTGDRAGPRPWSLAAALLVAAGLGWWIAGVTGLAVTLGTAVVCGLARTRGWWLARVTASAWPAVLAMLGATVAWVVGGLVRTSGNPAAPTDLAGDVVPQLLCLVVVGRLAIALWPYERAQGDGRPALAAAEDTMEDTVDTTVGTAAGIVAGTAVDAGPGSYPADGGADGAAGGEVEADGDGAGEAETDDDREAEADGEDDGDGRANLRNGASIR